MRLSENNAPCPLSGANPSTGGSGSFSVRNRPIAAVITAKGSVAASSKVTFGPKWKDATAVVSVYS